MFRLIFNILVKIKSFLFISWFYRNFIIKKSKISSNKKNVLFLDPAKFRGDIDCLKKDKKYNISLIESRWLWATISSFISGKIDILDYLNFSKSKQKKSYNKIDAFHKSLVHNICSHYKIDCVIIANYRYVEYLPWLKAFKNLSIPIIIFYRECLLTTERFYDGVYSRHKLFKNYPFDHIIVHNDITKKTFVSSHMAKESQVSVAGALRMDSLLTTINKKFSTKNTRRKKVTLFYFDYRDSLFGKEKLSKIIETGYGDKYNYVEKIWPYRENLFDDLHSTLIKLAINNPEIDVVIKAKKIQKEKNNQSWEKFIDIQKKYNVDTLDLKNYFVLNEGNVHNLIMESNIIIGLQSSTVLESAIANKYVIFPLFYNYSRIENFRDFHWHQYINLFEVADSGNQLYEMILNYLSNEREISSEIIEGRKKLFEKYFYNLEGKSLQKYHQIIQGVLSEHNEQLKINAQA
ncbi:MAG: hypothetical protein CMG74_13040 [Candidatus Marinimicrobia bacterium]|nr:hypothetical protein [Candidatus Neomarinimicrobiota bacterium]